MDRRDALHALALLAGIPAVAARRFPTPRATQLLVLNPAQNATVVALAERITPATDTPGATASRVNDLNAHNQCWDAPNVFVTDGSCMTSSACQNPSITYMALTARAAARAVDLLNRREL